MLELHRTIKKIASDVEYDEIKLAKVLFNSDLKGDKSLNKNILVKYLNKFCDIDIEIQNLKSVVNKKSGGILSLPEFMVNFNHSYFSNKFIDLLEFNDIQSVINSVSSFSPGFDSSCLDLSAHKIAIRMARHLQFNNINCYFKNPIISILKQRFNLNSVIVNENNIIADDVIYNINPAFCKFNELLKDKYYNYLFFSGVQSFVPCGNFTKKTKIQNAIISNHILSFDKFMNHYKSESLTNNCCRFIRSYGKDYFVTNKECHSNIVLFSVKEL